MASYADRFSATQLPRVDRFGCADALQQLEEREKARAAINDARRALAEGQTIDLVQVSRAFETLYGEIALHGHRQSLPEPQNSVKARLASKQLL